MSAGANNAINNAMTFKGNGGTMKSMEGYWSVKPKKRGGGNRKRPVTAKERKRRK